MKRKRYLFNCLKDPRQATRLVPRWWSNCVEMNSGDFAFGHAVAWHRGKGCNCWPVVVGGGGESEFGVCGGVGGMMGIELLAGKMRLDRGGIVAVEDDMRQTYTVKHIRNGLTLLSLSLMGTQIQMLGKMLPP